MAREREASASSRAKQSAPATTSEWPLRYLLAECIATSAPSASGRVKTGVAQVESTATNAPAAWAIRAAPSMSLTPQSGLLGVSSQMRFVERAATEAQEQRDRRRHARAENERQRRAFQGPDHRLHYSDSVVVRAAIRIAAAIEIVGVADVGGREVDRRHDRSAGLVDTSERLRGESARAPAPGVFVAHRGSPCNSFGAPRPAPPA